MKTIAALVLALSAFMAQAQTLKVATGQAGTYSAMFKEINGACANAIPLVEQATSGSIENLNALVGNQVNGAFVQTDVLYYRARSENLDGIKTLIALHPEEVHFVALSTAKSTTGGVMGIGSKPIVFHSIADLKDRKIAAAGGSVVTAQVIRLQSEIPYQVIEAKTTDAAIKLLDEGQVDAVVAVGGAPLASVDKLGAGYKILPINGPTAAKLKDVYRLARLTYSKMGASGVPTVATDALFVTREYKTARFVEGLSRLRSCILTNLDELKETTGTHPKWQAVDAANKGKWAWYDLGAKK